MSRNKSEDVVEISDDEEAGSPKPDARAKPGSEEPSSSLNKQTDSNKKLKITVKQNQNNQNSTKVVIEIDDLPPSQEFAKEDSYKCFLEDYNDESFTLEFLQLIELCLKYECSDGMNRILKRTLIPYYKSANRPYIESLQFQTFLEKTVSTMQREPTLKFSCIKSVCEVLKENKVKKRVNLVTLDKKVSVKRKSEYKSIEQSKKQNIVIDLDNYQSTSIIDIDTIEDDIDDVEIINDEKENCAAPNKEHLQSTNKENCEPQKGTQESQSQSKANYEQETRIFHQLPSLPPISPESIERNIEIKKIEGVIKDLKARIKAFDEMEVVDDHLSSPYIINHGLQAKLVEHYKILRKLRGESPVRRQCKEIVLGVTEGHPPGPARVLQDYMNQQILQAEGEDVPFPDFLDVVKCVTQANVEDLLGWGKAKILSIAQLLFRQIGTALQERRKKQEWRDMCRFVRDEARDPADEDPELQAKLEANRVMALQKESDVLEYYTKMEAVTKVNKKITILASKRDAVLAEISKVTPCSDQAPNDDFYLEFEIPQLITELQSQPQPQEASDQIQIDIKPIIVPNPIDPNIEIEVSDSEDYSSSEHEVSDFELDDVVPESSSRQEHYVTLSSISKLEKNINDSVKVTNPQTTSDNLCGIHATEPKNTSDNIEPTTEPKNTSDSIEYAKVNENSALVIEETNELAIKTEPNTLTKKTEQEDETLKFLLDVSNVGTEEITIKTSIFDIEEPVFFIEISSSSESECESEGEKSQDK